MLPSITLTNVLVLDIETVPQYANYSELPERFQLLWEAKSRISRKELTPEEFYERAGIWAEFGKIICISFARIVNNSSSHSLRVKSFYGDDERELLTEFSDLLDQLSPVTVFCAHNGKEFDFPYLCRRMLINDVPIPLQLQISGKKPWEIPFLDTMDLWKFGDYKHYISLNLLAAVFDIPTPKDDIDGSQVADVYYNENNLQRIVTYCQKDVITTTQILLRFKSLPLILETNITYIS